MKSKNKFEGRYFSPKGWPGTRWCCKIVSWKVRGTTAETDTLFSDGKIERQTWTKKEIRELLKEGELVWMCKLKGLFTFGY